VDCRAHLGAVGNAHNYGATGERAEVDSDRVAGGIE